MERLIPGRPMTLGPAPLLIFLAIVWLLVTPAAGQQSGASSIVEQFYPPSLTGSPNEIGGRQQCFAVYDADASGAPRTIVAAYTNHSDAVIRVLRANAGSFDVVAEPQGLDLSGVWCDVELEDIDANGRKEIRVDFSVNRSTASWLFRWDGQQLLNLTPTTGTAVTGHQATKFIDGDLLDVDNDGIKEVYVRSEYPQDPNEQVPPAVLYRLRGDQYVEDTRLVGAWRFERKTTTPETNDVAVALPQGARGPYRLRVVNGRPDGTARAARAQVWINRREVVSATTVDGQPIIERTVTLKAENTLAVRFGGRPRSELLLLLESDRWDEP
jgi:hypothetical protein